MDVTLIRHGNTSKAANDLDRQLTEAGVKQAMDRRKTFSREFDLVLSSTAVRARDTAAIIANVEATKVLTLEELYLPKDPGDKKAIDDMFAKLLYAPLRAYRDADVTGALFRYGENGAKIIRDAIENAGADNVLIVGHAVLLNAIVAYVVGETDLVLDTSLGEAEGFQISMNGRNVLSRLIQ